MKELFKGFVLFVILSFVFSLSGCTGVQSGNNTALNGPANSKNSAGRSGDYPPVASGIAEGVIHLLDGTKTKLSEHKGEVVILNLWGIWCGPCREEMPHLAAIQKQYGDKGLKVYGLNVGDHDGNAEPIDNIKRFAVQSKIDYTLARIEGPMINQFYMFSKQQVVPQTLLVDREGRVRGLFVGGGQRVFTELQQSVDKTMAE